MRIDWKDPGQTLGVVSVGVGLIFGILGLILSTEFREFAAKSWGCWILTVLILLVLSWAFSLRHKNARLKGKLAAPHFVRFEELTRIRYGHIPYYPFMDYEPHHHKPTGVGLRVLEELFGENVLVATPDGSTWENMIDRLENGDCDIIATPLFETRERSRRVAFSNPMFFADIGLYVRKEDANGKIPFTFSQVKDQLRVLLPRMKAEVIVGEVSEKMAKKFLGIPDERVTYLLAAEAQVSNLVRNLLDHGRKADVVFAERFLAESLEEVRSGKVVNVLRTKELLYPVGFAMRREDYILRNYINIKLMELDDKYPNRLIGFIINQLRCHPGFEWINTGNALEYFVREKSV